MKKLSTMLLAGVIATLVTGVAFAGTPRMDRRQEFQHSRIAHGRAFGNLTRGEAWRLRAGQRHIRRMERRGGADGSYSRWERRRVERAQDQQSRRIHRFKHNWRRI